MKKKFQYHVIEIEGGQIVSRYFSSYEIFLEYGKGEMVVLIKHRSLQSK